MVEFKESKFYKLLQDFFINNDKETFIQFLAEFYNRTEGVIDKNIVQDEIIKELREMFLLFNEEGIDENIVREKVNYFVENNVKIKDILAKLVINTNKIESNTEKLNTNTSNIENITSQLEQSEKEITELNSNKISYVSSTSGTVVFIDDDGYNQVLSILKPIYDEKGIKCSIAIPSSRVGQSGYLTLTQLKELQTQGFEILSHGYTHGDLTTLSADSLETHFKNFTSYFRGNGLESGAKYIVYPGNLVNTKVKNVAKKYCKGGFGGSLNINPSTIETFEIKRIDVLQKTLDEIKGLIDIAKNEKKLLVLYTHAWLLTTDDKIQLLKDVIDYVKSSGVEILNVEKAIEKHGNIIEAYGDGVGYSLGKSGLLNFTSTGEYGVKYLPTATVNLNSKTPLNYPVDSITIEKVMSGVEDNPYGNKCACIIITFRNPTDPFTCQISVPLGSYTSYTRYYNNKWTDWNALTLMSYIDIPIQDFSTPLTSYPRGITTQVCNYNAIGNTLGKTMLVTTHRVHSDLFGYQEMKATDSTIIYRRNWNNSTSTWGNIEQH